MHFFSLSVNELCNDSIRFRRDKFLRITFDYIVPYSILFLDYVLSLFLGYDVIPLNFIEICLEIGVVRCSDVTLELQ